MQSKQPSGNFFVKMSSTSKELPCAIATCSTRARINGSTASRISGQPGNDGRLFARGGFGTHGRYNRSALLLQEQMLRAAAGSARGKNPDIEEAVRPMAFQATPYCAYAALEKSFQRVNGAIGKVHSVVSTWL